MKLLVFGRDGQVGSTLTQALAPLGEITAYGRDGADFAHPERVAELARRHEADVIVNAVAYTAVDKAESEPELARLVNSETPAALAGVAAESGAWFLHYSTDYVFDGTKAGAYVEDDSTNPLSVYGVTKRDGELGVAEAGGKSMVLRTSWVHAPGTRNFIATMFALAQTKTELKMVSDQVGTPTSARLIAETTRRILERIERDRPPAPGIYHLTTSGGTSRLDYARFIVAEAARRGARLTLTPEAIVPIPSKEAPTPAQRPLNCHLSNRKLASYLGEDLPGWQEDALGTIEALVAGTKA